MSGYTPVGTADKDDGVSYTYEYPAPTGNQLSAQHPRPPSHLPPLVGNYNTAGLPGSVPNNEPLMGDYSAYQASPMYPPTPDPRNRSPVPPTAQNISASPPTARSANYPAPTPVVPQSHTGPVFSPSASYSGTTGSPGRAPAGPQHHSGYPTTSAPITASTTQPTSSSSAYPPQDHAVPNRPLTRGTTTVRENRPLKTEEREIPIGADGAFCIDVPVSKKALEGCEFTTGEEFERLSYTAATCDANDMATKYALRVTKYKRRIRIAVVLTMYNEEDSLLARTLSGVIKNISYLCSGKCASWEKEDWKHIVVVLVADGRAKVDPKSLNVLALMGCYMDGLAKATINNDPVKCHIFEYTTQICVTEQLTVRRPRDPARDGLTLVPMQFIFMLKEKNAKKINSHRWFLRGVCDQIKPDICILIDVGTKPSRQSFFHLARAFERNPNVGGACGEIVADIGKNWKALLNPFVAAQNFEYKTSNILDKPLETVFGYISVLPGAFSAYRYEALQGKPLECYFEGENPTGASLQKSNMYLAEDRILCFELTVKENASYILKYVKSASAKTDVPSTLQGLLSQRRRWINGSFFASIYATYNWQRISKSGHTSVRKFLLYIEFVYNLFQIIFGWFNLGNFYLTFYFLFNISSSETVAEYRGGYTDNSSDPFNPYGEVVFEVVKAIYFFSIVMTFIAALGNRPDGYKVLYNAISIVFALLMVLMLFMSIWTIKVSIEFYNANNDKSVSGFFNYVKATPAFRDIVISVISTYGIFLFSSLIHLDPWHVFTCLFQYLLLIPTWINILMVYSFCNLHDITWGNRPEEAAAALPSVIVKKDGTATVEVEVPDVEEDIDQHWDHLLVDLQRAREKKAELEKEEAKKNVPSREDNFKQLRTLTLLLWIFSNGLLCYIFTSPQIIAQIFPKTYASSLLSKQHVNPYLTFLFWAVFIMSMFRFIVSTIYIIGWGSESAEDAGKRSLLAPLRRSLAAAIDGPPKQPTPKA